MAKSFFANIGFGPYCKPVFVLVLALVAWASPHLAFAQSDPCARAVAAPKNKLSDEEGAACAEALALLAPQQQVEIVVHLLRQNPFFVSNNEKIILAESLGDEAARRLKSFAAIRYITRDNADQTLDKLIEQGQAANDKFSLAYLYKAKGDYVGQSREFDRWKILLERAHALATEEEITGLIPTISYGLGRIALAQKRYNDALHIFDETLVAFDKIGAHKSRTQACYNLYHVASLLTKERPDIGATDHPIAAFFERSDISSGCVVFGVGLALKYEMDDPQAGSQHMAEATDIFEREDLNGVLMRVHHLQSRWAIHELDYVEGVRLAEKGLEAAEQAQDDRAVSEMLRNIGTIHSDLKNSQLAIDYYQQSFDVMEASGLEVTTYTAGITYLNIASEYALLEDWPRALELYELAAEKLNAQATRTHHPFLYFHHAMALHELGRKDEAMAMAEEAVQYSEEYNPPVKHASTLAWIAGRYLDADDRPGARAKLQQANDTLEEANLSPNTLAADDEYSYWRLMLAENMSDAMMGLGLAEQAVPYLKAAVEISQSQFKADNVKALANMEMQFDLQEKERELTIMRQENELGALKLRASRARNIAFGIGAAFVLLLCGLLYRSYRSKTKLAEMREMLLREVQHRAKNNLQILSSLLRLDERRAELKGAEAAAQVDAGNRARTMAILHDRLYAQQGTALVDSNVMLNDLLALLEKSLGPAHVNLIGDIDAVKLDADTATPLGLVVCELVTNAYKHAFDGRSGAIRVSFKVRGRTVDLTVEDTGKGFDPAAAAGNSLGIGLIHDLSNQLGGLLNVESGPQGTVWTISGIAFEGLVEASKDKTEAGPALFGRPAAPAE
ncbi:MAG: histidine kinase dimerization/phosphoacceptor domain -containing protein [Pseudomonadota bacterium]